MSKGMLTTMRRFCLRPLGWLLALLLSASCGGEALVAGGGIGGSGISIGVITILGSVRVNGVTYDTDQAAVTVNGEPADFNQLRVGMVVEVEGTVNPDGTGVARTVRFDTLLRGPVIAMTETSPGAVKTLTVLGQTIVVDEETVMAGIDFAALGAASPVVEISGLARDGSVQATLLRQLADDETTFLATGGEFEVEGTMTGLAGRTFRIGALTIDVADAVLQNLELAPGGVLVDGLRVEVKGTLSAGILTASRVEVKRRGLAEAELERAEIEGFVTGLDPAAQTFLLGGQPVSFAGAAFRGGSAADLGNGLRVEAEGPVRGGVLEAGKIHFKESVRIEANAAAIRLAGDTLTLQGLGLTVKVDSALTEFRDVAGLEGIAPGSHLKIRGRPGKVAGTVVATRIELVSTSSESRVSLQGPVEAFDPTAGTVQILGVTVSTGDFGNSQFMEEDAIIGRDAFFGALAPGVLVKARADLAPTTSALTWNQVELER